jgi:hypothetical protein
MDNLARTDVFERRQEKFISWDDSCCPERYVDTVAAVNSLTDCAFQRTGG